MRTGHVLGLWRHPVKSMRGEAVADARLGVCGMGGDRVHGVYDGRADGVRRLTARDAPGLLAWRAGYPAAGADLDPVAPPPATVTGPSGQCWEWGDPALRVALQDDLGRPVVLRRDIEGIYDVPRSVLVTTEASRLALERELGAPVDVRRFRTNLHLDTDTSAWAEPGWAGAALRLPGGAALELFKPCRRCVIPTRDPDTRRKWPELLRQLEREHELTFGIYGRVVAGGTISVGDRVELESVDAATAA